MQDVILLISGNSRRMGQEKALLPFSKNKNFVCQLVDTYLKLSGAKIFLVVNSQNANRIQKACMAFRNQIQFVVNTEAYKGRHWSILTALGEVKKGRGVFIQNIDNPFTSLKLIREMQKNYQAHSFLVPQFQGKNGHPILLGADLVSSMKADKDKIIDFKAFLNENTKVCMLTNEKEILANINSPEEYRKWFSNA